jgi:hypothetical protein
VPALWHLARAASLQGEGALPEAQRRELAATLERAYTAYHGDASGLEELRAGAAANAYPPDGFNVESAAAATARRQDEELNRTNPQLAQWLRIRKQLEAPGGEKYLAETLSTAPLPRLKGVLIRGTPANKPQEIGLGIQDPAVEEVVLKLDTPLPGPADAGTPLEFEGTAAALTRDPFSLTVNASPGAVTGWPERQAAIPKSETGKAVSAPGKRATKKK